HADVAAFAFKHVYAVGDLGGLDLHRIEIALLCVSTEAQRDRGERDQRLPHAASFSSSQALSGSGRPARSAAVSLRSGSILSDSRISISWRVCCVGCQTVRSSTMCSGCLPK